MNNWDKCRRSNARLGYLLCVGIKNGGNGLVNLSLEIPHSPLADGEAARKRGKGRV